MDLAEFVDIIGYEGLYKINKNGDIYGVKNKKILKPSLDRHGYYKINLCKNGKRKTYLIHRFIALHFIPNDDETKNYVDHIDGNQINNYIENLRWVTPVGNSRNKVSNYICQYIQKKTGHTYYHADYSIYINENHIRKKKGSIHRHKVEEWLEQMKKDYPNEYTSGRNNLI